MPRPQEVEAQYKPGSIKHVMVQVFKAVQPEGLTLAGGFFYCPWVSPALGSNRAGMTPDGKAPFRQLSVHLQHQRPCKAPWAWA
jgi:hypothetical protein